MSEQNNICKYIDCFPTPKILIRSLYLILAIGNLFGYVVACSRCSDRGDHTKRCEQKQKAIIGSWQKKKKKEKNSEGALHYPNAWNRLVMSTCLVLRSRETLK